MNLFGNRRKEFEKLAWPFSGDLYRLAYWRLGSAQDAEDAVQESYLRAFRSFHTFQPGTNIKGWLTKILLNVINDALSKRARQLDNVATEKESEQVLQVADQSNAARDPQVKVTENEISPELMEALRRLPSMLLHPLLMRELQDMSYNDIARVLDVPTGTVMSRLFRARRLVRERLTMNTKRSAQEVGQHEVQ
jgi:RNA polymerase sigma-70 factor, ECF subfamily